MIRRNYEEELICNFWSGKRRGGVSTEGYENIGHYEEGLVSYFESKTRRAGESVND